MREFENYIRYAMPGIASIIPLFLAFLISDYDATRETIITTRSIGPALALVLGSGGLGFLYSGIYFAVYWILMPIDHRALLKRFEDEGHLKIEHKRENKEEYNKREAWERVGIIWDIALAESKRMRKINDRIKKLNARLHGIGCTFVGILLAVLFWLVFHYIILNNAFGSTDLIVYFCFLLFLSFFFCNYISLRRIHQSVARKALSYYMYSIDEEHNNQGKFPIVFDDDL